MSLPSVIEIRDRVQELVDKVQCKINLNIQNIGTQSDIFEFHHGRFVLEINKHPGHAEVFLLLYVIHNLEEKILRMKRINTQSAYTLNTFVSEPILDTLMEHMYVTAALRRNSSATY